MPPPPLYLEVLREPFEKWWPNRLLYAKIFERVLDIIRIKVCHLKGENEWESSRRLKSSGLAISEIIEGLKATN